MPRKSVTVVSATAGDVQPAKVAQRDVRLSGLDAAERAKY